MDQVTECINCRWKAENGLSHEEHVKANRMMSWLCSTPPIGELVAVAPPRPQNADPVLDEDGHVTGYTVRT